MTLLDLIKFDLQACHYGAWLVNEQRACRCTSPCELPDLTGCVLSELLPDGKTVPVDLPGQIEFPAGLSPQDRSCVTCVYRHVADEEYPCRNCSPPLLVMWSDSAPIAQEIVSAEIQQKCCSVLPRNNREAV